MNVLIYSVKSVLLSIFIVLTFLKSIDFIYLFQIKEYRFDRFFAFLKEVGLTNVLYFRRPRTPSKSFRNILLMILTLIFILIFPADLVDGNLYTSILLFLAIPLISFCFVIIGVWLTGFIATIKRNSIIDKARDKVTHSKVIFIGITGSYGKSSVKEFLYQILSAKYKTAKTDENMNTDVGVALSILNNLKPDTEYFIAEMGAYKMGEIKVICDLVHPQYGILTAIGNQHLSLFGSKENLESAKSELLQALPKEGKAYLNSTIENKSFFESKTKCAKTYYAINEKSDIYAEQIQHSTDGLTAKIAYGKQSFTIQTKLIGSHNIENLLPAIGVGIDLGMTPAEIQKAVSELKNVEAKLSLHKGINGSTILNDAKNSSVDGFIAALKTLSSFPDKKKYIISKGIIELGVEKGESYERIVSVLNDVSVTLITTDSLFKKYDKKDSVLVLNDEMAIFQYMKKNTNKESIAVIEGKFTKIFIESIINH